MTAARAALLGLACVAISSHADAQARLDTRVSARRVEVGQPFRVELSVEVEGAKPSDPRLPLPPGMQAEGPQMGTQTQVSIINGRMQQSTRVTAAWRVIASKPGTFRLGPPQIEIEGRVQRGQPISVEVVPGGLMPRPSPFGAFPFDLFDLPDPLGGRPLPGLGLDPHGFDVPDHPPEYAIERAPDPVAFLVTKVSPQRVVVGEAVRVDVLAYGARGEFQAMPATEPSREGFLAYDINENPRSYRVPIGDESYVAKRVNAFVFFPLRTGTLKIGSSSFEFVGGGYSARQSTGLRRESAPVNVLVSEPPLEGRPPGYRVGDVGRYTLRANVEPRTVTEGAGVSVVVTLEGAGNLPATLTVPGQKGVEWLEPTTAEQIEVSDGNVQGKRSFAYVVKLERSGEVDLGTLELPYWDPEKRRYAVARAPLGEVVVKPDPARAQRPSAAEPNDPLRGLLPPPRGFGRDAAEPSYLADRAGFWAALALGPLFVLVAGAAVRLAQRALERRKLRRELPEERAARELERAAREKAQDPTLAAASAERAVLLAIESATGLRARGVLRAALPAELGTRGVRPELAREIVELLDRCESVRFSGASPEVASQAVDAAGTIVLAFKRGKWK